MGFLDNLLKNKAKQIISDKIDDKFGTIRDSFTRESSKDASESAKRTRRDNDSITQKLDTIFTEEFSEYEVRENISAQDFQAEEGAQNYSYGLYLNGEPKAMFMILNGNNEYKKASVVKAQYACSKNGIPYMNFMSYMANHYDYVSNRIHNAIH